MTIIPGRICRLRLWKEEDEESLARHANSRKVWINLEERFPFPYTLTDARTWIEHCQTQAVPEKLFAIDVEGEAVGGIGLRPKEGVYHRTAELGYWLGEAFWGRGIATEAVELMSAYTFDVFDFMRIQACVFSWNPGSARVLEKTGYELEGRLQNAVTKDGEIADLLIYARIRAK